MDSKQKAGIVLLLLLCSGVTMYSYDRADNGIKIFSDDDYQDIGTNYEGLFLLGVIPNTDSRQPQQNDIDTQIKLRSGDNIYSLMESRTWVTGDYGKTFVVLDS